MVGIYKITNISNGKSYIGQSVNIEQRWENEIARSFNKNSESYQLPLCRAIRKYGVEQFTFEVLTLCSVEELNDKERYYIFLYKTLVPFGYNIATGGQAFSSSTLTYEEVGQIINLLKDDTVLQRDIAKQFGVSKDTITDINLGHTWFNPLETYPIRPRWTKCPHCGQRMSSDAKKCSHCYHLLSRVCERPSADQLIKEIATSSFVSVAKKYNVSDKTIVKWCRAYGIPVYKKEIVQLFHDHTDMPC